MTVHLLLRSSELHGLGSYRQTIEHSWLIIVKLKRVFENRPICREWKNKHVTILSETQLIKWNKRSIIVARFDEKYLFYKTV